jgi:hypothetical protein
MPELETDGRSVDLGFALRTVMRNSSQTSAPRSLLRLTAPGEKGERGHRVISQLGPLAGRAALQDHAGWNALGEQATHLARAMPPCVGLPTLEFRDTHFDDILTAKNTGFEHGQRTKLIANGRHASPRKSIQP